MRCLPIPIVANSILVQVGHPMLKIFPETLDPQQLYGGLCGGKLNHKFSLGLAPITWCWKYYLNVMRGTDMFGQLPGYLGHEELRSDWSHIDVYSCYGLL